MSLNSGAGGMDGGEGLTSGYRWERKGQQELRVTEVSILGVSLYSNTITREGKPRSGQVWGQPAGFGYRDPIEWPLWLNPNGCSSFSFSNVTFSLSSVNFFLFPKTSLSWISSYLSDPSFSGMQKKRGVWRRLSVVGYCSYLLSTLSLW